ncbi:MAG TPA: ABC transporter permease, partial [Candidatus Angelobacter sp.]|nr:ABC transporter permease [Candidatus Angelobacter sp.]
MKSLRHLFNRPGRNGDLAAEEIRFHLEKEIAQNIGAGMSPEEARRRALIAFGGVEQTRESLRRMNWSHQLETAFHDLRYGVRMLRKSPGTTVVIVAILALGIGANAAIFSCVKAVLFTRWPVPHQEQLMLVREATATNQGFLVSVPDLQDYRRQQTTFTQLSLWLGQSINLTGRGHPEKLIGAYVSDNFFEMLGVSAAQGRTFLPADDLPGVAPVAVISYDAWQARFGGDPALLGGKLTLNNELFTVVGILPRGFSVPVSPSEVFIPARHYQDYKEARYAKSFLIFGRMKDGVTQQQATADLDTIARRLAREYPRDNAGIHTELTSLQQLTTEKFRTPLFVLMAAVTAVLLIVCANVANLLLARGAARESEVAVRSALGASRARLIRQFFCESLILSALGGAGGVLVTRLALRVLQRISPVEVDLDPSMAVNGQILLFTVVASSLTGLCFGMMPALRFSRTSQPAKLANSGRALGRKGDDRLRSAFSVCQLAGSLSLLVITGLLAKSFAALIETNPGFNADHVLTMEYRLPPSKYPSQQAKLNFHRRMEAEVGRVPGVLSAAIVQGLPLSGNWGEVPLDLPGQALSGGLQPTALSNAVTPEYFSAIEIPLLKGRPFTVHDDDDSAPVVVISQSFARKFFPGRDAVGQEIKLGDSTETTLGSRGSKRATVIGVVGNAKQRSLREDFAPQIYFSYAQVTGNFGTLVVRTAVPPEDLTEPVRQAVWRIDKDQPVWRIRTLDSLIAKDVAPGRFVMLLMAAFSGLAVVLSGLGTYAMLSHSVHQRTRELGLRMALGAGRGSIFKLILAQGVRL